ncbi:hypothetical protein GWA97_10475 [Flavobacterium sp. LaA7.5]|nr:hypothetical protein [Flavobacterium salilacus subsp. altitudinum]
MKTFKFYGFISLVAFGLLIFSCSANEEATDKSSEYMSINTDKVVYSQKSASFEKIVGTYDIDGNITITADTLELKTIFQNDLKSNGINTTLDKIEIRKGIVGGTTDEYFSLIAHNNDSTVYIATQVFPSPSLVRTLIVMMRSNGFFDSTCTCNGCRRGCTPNVFENDQHRFEWECTACQVGDANDCRKTVTEKA